MRYTSTWYDTDTRFDAIADYLGDRPVEHVLDFGALNTVMARRFIDRYHCHVVAVDDTPELHQADGVDTVNRRLGPADIRRLGHFQVGLALSVLHHQKQWRNTLNALLDTCDTLFVELAHPDEILPGVDTHKNSQAMHDEVTKRGGHVLCETPGWDARYLRTLYVLRQ